MSKYKKQESRTFTKIYRIFFLRSCKNMLERSSDKINIYYVFLDHFLRWRFCLNDYFLGESLLITRLFETIGIDEGKIKKYVKYQEDQERLKEQQTLNFDPLYIGAFTSPHS